MRAANQGDAAAYRRVLEALAPFLRGAVRRGFARCGLGPEDVEDVVQETLLAIHLKRHTWDERRPLGPWVQAIARNKLADNLRRRKTHKNIPIDDIIDGLAAEDSQPALVSSDREKIVGALSGRKRDIVTAISVEGLSIKETAAKFGLSEVAVRVALHRGLKALAEAFRGQ